MSLNFNRAPFDFPKAREADKKEDRYDEYVNALLQENGLYRKKLPKGPDSLMRAVSDALNFTSLQQKGIQQSLLTHLTQLIASNKVTPRLNSFQGSSTLLKDFANNPQLTGFEKTNLELVSLFFKVRVILYTMNEDHYLSATIYNNNFTKTIELLRTKTSHYDAVFPVEFIKKAGICQNIILNLIDRAMNGPSHQYKNINGDEYVNITFESANTNAALSKDPNNLDQFRITRGPHKKSLSDNFNTNFEVMEEQQNKLFDVFINASPPDDFMKNFKMRKDTAESGFSINANFDFIDEQGGLDSPPGQEFAIKNYPIPSGRLSPRNTDFELDSPMPAFTNAKFSNHPNVLFGENLTLDDIERMEKSQQGAKQMGASPFYRNASPPGLSPATKFSQRSFTEVVQTPNDFLSPSPTMSREGNMEPVSPSYLYGNNSPNKRNMSPYVQSNFPGMSAEKGMFNPQQLNNQRAYHNQMAQPFAPQSQTLSSHSQAFSLHPQPINNLYMKRGGNVGSSMSIPSQASQSEEFGMGYQQGMQFDNGMDFDQSPMSSGDYDPSGMFGGFNREKKKPIILDESKERYNGRLKFFDENKKYGFIVMDEDGSDIFVHYDDLIKAGITKDLLRTARMGNVLRLTFGCMAYIGKYNRSRKAIDIQFLG